LNSLIKVILPLCLLFIFVSCKSPLEGYIEQSNKYYDEGKWDLAIIECTKAIEIDPNSIQARITRAAAYVEKAKYAEAIADCTAVINRDPDNTIAYYQRSMTYIKNGDYDKAIADCNQVIELGMKNHFAYFNRGVAYAKKSFASNDPASKDLALADFFTATKLSPNAEFNKQIDFYIQQLTPSSK
jgi:tetratricopeptide (TPR) repeat protein